MQHDICNDQTMFINKQKVYNTKVKLPNQMLIQVHFMGNIQLNGNLILKDVLYVPQFELNIISVTSLTQDKITMVGLYYDHAIIQQMSSNKIDDWQG